MKFFLGLLCLLFASIADASASVTVTFLTANSGTDSSGILISPYGGTIDGRSVSLYCDDFANDVSVGESWSANYTPLADLSTSRYGFLPNAVLLYQQAAFLTRQFGTDQTASAQDTNAKIQDTIWSLFNPNSANPTVIPPASDSYWMAQAASNYARVNLANFFLLTNVSPVLPSGQIQEFIVFDSAPVATAPETSSLILLGFGLVGIFAAASKLRKV